MFERFTEGLRKVMSLARQEAQHWNSDSIGTEHLLIGILVEDKGIAAKVLKHAKINLHGVRLEVKRLIKPVKPAVRTLGQIPFSPRAKDVIILSGEASCRTGSDDIGTEHLLLGLLREREGVAWQILQNIGADCTEIEKGLHGITGIPDEESNRHGIGVCGRCIGAGKDLLYLKRRNQ